MPTIPPLSEASMQSAENCIPRLASEAGRAAHQRALATTGWVIMKSGRGSLVKRDAGGHEEVIKDLPQSTPSSAGTVLRRAKKTPRNSASGR